MWGCIKWKLCLVKITMVINYMCPYYKIWDRLISLTQPVFISALELINDFSNEWHMKNI